MMRRLFRCLALVQPNHAPGKEMEAIRAANLLTNNDAHGGAWIAFNKPAGTGDAASGGRGGRRGGRRRG